MALGNRDTASLVMLTGWDATELANHALQDGTTYAAVVAQLNAALGALNNDIFNHPIWGSLVTYQDRPEVEYRVGVSNGFGDFTEYGQPDAARAATEGHMIPLKAFDRALGWTWDYLRKARMSQIEADIADGLKDAKDKWRVSILTRMLQRGDDSGANKGLGSSGYSPGFATDAGSTLVDFVPPSFGGNVFTSAHEHYVGVAGGAFTAAVFQDAKAELREHGHEPSYNFAIGASDEVTVRALTSFVPVGSDLVAYGALQDLARSPQGAIADGAYPIGTIEDFLVFVVPGIPQYYGFGWKSYGMNSQRNPLAIRLQKGVTQPMVTAFSGEMAAGPRDPLKGVTLFMEYGVGVNDRTAATPRYVNNAVWADGTPT